MPGIEIFSIVEVLEQDEDPGQDVEAALQRLESELERQGLNYDRLKEPGNPPRDDLNDIYDEDDIGYYVTGELGETYRMVLRPGESGWQCRIIGPSLER